MLRGGAAFKWAGLVASLVVVPSQLRAGDALCGDGDPEVNQRPFYLQFVNPADKQREFQESAEARESSDPSQAIREPRASYELPAIDVVGERGSGLREEERVGPYRQPRWAARRNFTNTRVYVRPPGTAEVEYWLRPTVDDGATDIRTLYELSIGLGNRLQLDLYFRNDTDGDDGETLLGQQVELRYALADWGVIPGNPTLYGEWAGLEQRPDKFEAKLLLGDEIAPRWHWGVNLGGEFETSGEREYEYQLTGGLSYSVIDSKLWVGLEGQMIAIDTKEDRGDYDWEYLLGPSIQYRPLPQVHVTFAPLVGLTEDSPDFRAFLVIGYEF